MSDIAISVKGLGKKYIIGHQKSGDLREAFGQKLKHLFAKDPVEHDEFWALKDLNFEIKKGEAVGIIGRNGAGKSTLLKILSRICEPSTGRFEINGRVSSLLEVGTGFHAELTGRENIYLNGTILGMRRAEVKAKFDEIVAFSGVEKFIDTPVKHYSSGMKVRLAFSVAAHLEPEILIVDEVLAVGDAEFQKKCLGKMDEVSKNEGRTVLFVSHNMGVIQQLCPKTIYLKESQLYFFGETTEAIRLYQNIYKVNTIVTEHPIVKKMEAYSRNDEIIIFLHFEGYNFHSPPFLGFIITDHFGNPIFGSNPKISASKLPEDFSSEGVISARIKKPVLRSGIYNIMVWFGDGTVDIFESKDALSIQIDNLHSTNHSVHLGAIIPEVLWEIENGKANNK